MKRILLVLILGSFLSASGLIAQFVPQGISYQAAALDASGQPMANRKLTMRISMVSEEGSRTIHFSELHQVRTDDQGVFSLVIGEGRSVKGTLDEVPFAAKQIWLHVEMEGKRPQQFTMVNHSRLLSVPYAMHANTATRLASPQEEAEEKNQSIYWLTGGNTETSPATQFLGTRDSRDFILKTRDTTRVTITKNGQFIIDSGVDGDDEEIGSYPLTVEGSAQGIYIKVNGSRDKNNNYLTFGDSKQFSWGRVEGQTFSNLQETWQYQLQVAQYALSGAALALRIAAFIAAQVGESSGVCCQPVLPGRIFGTIGLTVEAAGLLANSITWGVNIAREIGVSYSTGAGDYAEWLERVPEERDLFFGEIVGVRAGKVSLNTDEADHLLVVSMAPGVLGNMPQPGEEARFEKISFMGQVPVKVAGPVAVGDYILPSGNHDGIGIAIHPKDMQAGDYAHVVGVAWEATDGKMPLFTYVKTAVGINTNDLSRKVDLLNRRVENILAYLEGTAPLLSDEELDQSVPAVAEKPQTKLSKVYSDEEIDRLLDQGAPLLKGLYPQLEAELKKQGIDLESNPYIKAFMDDPIPALKDMRRNPAFYTQWALLDRQLPAKRGQN